MHFCSVLIYLIMCCFDVLFMFFEMNRLLNLKDEDKVSPVVIFLLVLMMVYHLVAIFYCYRAQTVFKELFMAQHQDWMNMGQEG